MSVVLKSSLRGSKNMVFTVNLMELFVVKNGLLELRLFIFVAISVS